MRGLGLVACLLCLLVANVICYAQEEGVLLDKIVVTSTRSEEYIQNAPNSVTVITKQEIQNSNAKIIPDLIREKAGVMVKEYSAGTGKLANVDIRGFGEAGLSNTLVLVDGRRVTQIDLSGTDWVQIPLDEVERIEIIRGAGSVFYGDNASGGVVNIITKQGKGKPEIKIESKVGSYASYDSKIESEGEIEGINYYAMASVDDSAGFRNNNDIVAKDFGLKLGHKFSQSLNTKLSLGYHKDSYGLPGPLNDDQLNSLGRKATVFPLDDADSLSYFGNFMLETDLEQRGKFATDISVAARQVKSNYMSVFPWQTDNYITTFGFTPKYILSNSIKEHDNKLTLGLDYYDAQDHIKDGPPNGENNVIIISKKSLGFYVFDQLDIMDNLLFSNGYRLEKARYNFEQISAEANKQSLAKTFDNQVLSSGINYIYDKKDSHCFFNFSQSFRFPLVDEFFSSGYPGFGGGGLDTSLIPQQANNYELGLRHYFTKDIYAGFTLFNMLLHNEIYFDPFTFKSSNYDRTIHQGVEYEFKSRLGDRINLFANYTFTDAYFLKGEFAGNKIPAVPVHKWSAGFDIDLLKGINFTLLTNYVGERRFISDQRNRFPRMASYITVDIGLSYKKDNFTIFGGINNLFDENYYEYGTVSNSSGKKNYYPSCGRNFFIASSFKF